MKRRCLIYDVYFREKKDGLRRIPERERFSLN